MPTLTPEEIDGVLPQTQCGLCNHAGCMPYAEALAYENAAINLCPPGGITTLKKLGQLLQKDPTPYLAEMTQKAKQPQMAIVREDECIGCTKCIQACPVDAILGSAKQMHTIIASECTGCELCIPACPVDCIDLIALNEPAYQADVARKRFNAREQRLTQEKIAKHAARNLVDKQQYINNAIARVKAKKQIF